MRETRVVSVLVILLSLPLSGTSAAQNAQVPHLKTLSLEELMQIDVTTVSRASERRIDVPAAVSVITGEDLRRYGVDTIADALRLADSVSVARFNGGSWGISTRGFTAITNNKLLVMIDGRSVYTPLFGGVFWEAQHVMLSDIERIEVIRGPAGVMWGPNAVNGVINIITKPADETGGALVRAVTGSRERAHVVGRYGGQLSPRAAYRVYAIGSQFDSPRLADGTSADEDRALREAGGRIDWNFGDAEHLTIQGDGLRSRMGLADRPDITMSAANLVASYSRRFERDSSFQVLGYIDGEERDVPRQSWESRTTFNIDAQHRSRVSRRYHLIWGGGFRSTVSRTRRTELIFFEPDNRTIHQVHAFAQTEVAVGRNVSVTLGTRAERTTFAGFDLQPSVRAKYTPDNERVIWAAVSRAVRTPTRFDRDLRVHLNDVVLIRGEDDFRPEQLVAYETGARFRTGGHVAVEASVFRNQYDDLRSQEGRVPPIRLGNLYEGHTTGFELAGDVQPHPRWLLHASYTGQRVRLHPSPGGLDVTSARAEADDPSQMFSLRSYLNLPGAFEADAFFRAVGKLRASSLPGYRELDVRLGCSLTSDFEIALIGRDLLHGQHAEFAGATPQLRYFQREVALRVTWRSR
jgi:iron complex outermembrane receptor protein